MTALAGPAFGDDTDDIVARIAAKNAEAAEKVAFLFRFAQC